MTLALSRLPIKHTFSDSEVPVPGDLIHLLNHLQESIVTATQIKDWTDNDPLSFHVRKLVENVLTVLPKGQYKHSRQQLRN